MRDLRFDDAPTWARPQEPTPEDLEVARSQARKIAAGPVAYERIKQTTESSHIQSASWWYAFDAELASAIREDPTRQRAWADMLVAAVNEAKRVFPPTTKRKEDERALVDGAEDWQRERDPFCVWGHGSSYLEAHYEDWYTRILSLLNLLVRIDPGRGLRLCDALPFPGMMEGVFYWGHDVRQDRELIETLLVAAPIAFDRDGTWKPERSVAALLITDLVVVHAQKLHAAVAARVWSLRTPAAGADAPVAAAELTLREVETTELPGWMRRAFDILLARADGRVIAMGYLARLVEQVHREQSRGTAQETKWSTFECGLAALCEALVAEGLSTADVREAWTRTAEIAKEKEQAAAARRIVRHVNARRRGKHKGEGARKLHGRGMSYLLGAALMLDSASQSENVASQSENERLWAWFADLLEARDPGLRLVEHGPANIEAAQRIGLLLSRSICPAELFHKTYDRLEPQRRRAQHPSYYGYDDHDLETTFLLRVGLYAGEFWVKTADEPEAPRQLLIDIYAFTRRLWLTAAHDFDNTKRDLVPLCFAFMPALFGDQLRTALAKAIPPISNHPKMLARACWLLWNNGVEATTLARLVRESGGNLEEALRDVKQWADLLTSKQREIEFPPDLQQLAEALSISFPTEEPAPESERLALRRKDFLRAIPWGAALVHRLEEDGLTQLHLAPFDDGTTWLLQAQVPDALRDRFGLAPQIRVLVVHGQVRARDLRLALEEPRGAGDVDPDLLVVASDWPVLQEKIRHLAGPWGQRVPWTPDAGVFIPLAEALREHLARFDLFAQRDPIRGRALIGRRDNIDYIAARLLRGQAVAVLGLRKVGKSSLLQAVAAHIDAEALVVSFDVQGLVQRTLHGLADRLARELRARLALAGVREASTHDVQHEGSMLVVSAPVGEAPTGMPDRREQDPLAELERLLHLALNAQPRPLAFVLDEYDLLFEGYSGEPGIPELHRLFALLRSLSQATGRVSLAFIGRDPVFVQRPHLGGFTSPLLGWVEPTWLGPLRRDEADELLVRLGKRTCLDVGAATREAAWQWTGGHPLLMREYGSALFELAHAPPSRPRTVETDMLRDDAVEVFYRRDAVQTICGEVRMLLELRFPEALGLLTALADAPMDDGWEVVAQRGGPRDKAATVLAGFGLLMDPTARAWVPELWRNYFKSFGSHTGSVIRSGTGGE